VTIEATETTTHLFERRRWSRQRWTVCVAGFLGCFLFGVGFAHLVQRGGDWTHGLPWERALLVRLHHPLPTVLDRAVSITAWAGTNITLIPVVALTAGWLWMKKRRRHLAIQLFVAQLGSYLLNPSLKTLFERPRPDLFERRGWYGWSSYPSGHAIASIAVLMTLALVLHEVKGWRWTYPVAAIVMLMSIYSRLYLAVHWPTDVFAGAIMGTAWMAVTTWAFREHFENVPEREDALLVEGGGWTDHRKVR
jgi:undecaprenyl-diphosphatase